MSAMDEVMAQMFGCSVTQRIKQVDQPKGGYIKPKEFKAELLGKGTEALNSAENVSPILVGLAVDYMTRFMSGASDEDAFEISLKGLHSIHPEFKDIKYLGIYNPRMNTASRIAVEDIAFALSTGEGC